ncbi:MAG: cupin domain-containing protein [Planctomycetes bacterium]|nr:cupin domain-containing protein [Planctomycetota bacterium]
MNQPKVVDLNDKKEYQRVLCDKADTLGLKVGRVYLEQGSECGLHSTEAREEALIFLQGTGQAIIGKNQKAFDVAAGKVAYIPPHTEHNIKNTGPEPLVYVFCVTPVKNA